MPANLDASLPCGLQNKSQRKDTVKNFAGCRLSKKKKKKQVVKSSVTDWC